MPDDLRMVAAGTAASTVVISNSSRRARALLQAAGAVGGALSQSGKGRCSGRPCTQAEDAPLLDFVA